jgi:rhamnosyl/mannosyltransferase
METHLESLCAGLRDSYRVSALVANAAGSTVEEMVADIPVCRCASTLSLSSAPISSEMVKRIRSSSADIVHLHSPNPGAVLAYSASQRSSALVVTHHSDVVRQKVLGRAYLPIYQRLLRKSDAIIVTSSNYLNSSLELSLFKEKCSVIPLGIDMSNFDQYDAGHVRSIEERFGQRIILAVGRLVYYKGFEYLIRAMKDVQGQLVIVGDGPLRRHLQEMVLKLGLVDKITLAGNLDAAEMSAFYHACKMMVLPSIARSEAFGIVQIEAMACGKPVINTSLDSGVPFVSTNCETGITVPPFRPDLLAQAINLLLENEELRQRLGTAGRERAQRLFSVERMVNSTKHVYEQVMQKRSTSMPAAASA